MSTLKKYFFLTAIIFLFGCKKEQSVMNEWGVLTGIVKVSSSNVVFSAKLIKNPYVSEFGFVWSGENELPTLNDYSVICNEIRDHVYSIELSSQFVEGAVYYLRAFYRTRNNEVVYGNTSKFIAPKTNLPEIIDVIPKEATWGDTIKVVCKNLSYKIEDHSIHVQNDDQTFNFKINSIKQDTISAVVPKNLNTFFPILTLNLWDSQVDTSNLFTLQPPVVNSISPDTIVRGDFISIQGEYFYNPNIYEYPSIIIGGSVYEGGSYSDQDDDSKTFIDVEFNDWDFEKGKHYFKLKYLDYELDSVPFIFDETIIDKIIPSSVTFGDTVEVIGKRFPYFNISLEGVIINQLYSSRNKIVFQVPVNPDLAANDTILDLMLSTGFDNMGGNNESFNEVVYLKKPVIESLSNITGKVADEIIIRGKYFSPYAFHNTVWFGDKRAEVIMGNANELNARIPLYSDKVSDVSVKVSNIQSEAIENFTLLEPKIESISPLNCTYGTEITITGFNFIDEYKVESYYAPDYNPVDRYGFAKTSLVYFNDKSLFVTNVSTNSITAKFNSDLIENTKAPLLLKIGNQTVQSNEEINYSYPWTYKGGYKYNYNPYIIAMSGIFTSVDGKGYLGLTGGVSTQNAFYRNNSQYLYEFDPKKDTVKIIETLDNNITSTYNFGIAYQSNLIVFLNHDIWEYNILNKVWSKLKETNLTGAPGNYYGGFLHDDDFYIIFSSGSNTTKVYKFNLQSKTWNELNEIPYKTCQIGVTIGDDIYLIAGGDYFLKYKTEQDQWEELQNIPVNISPYYRYAMFYFNNRIYCYANNYIYYYEIESNTWTKTNQSPPFNTIFGYSMIIDEKCYVGGGYDGSRRIEEKIYQFYPELLK